MFRCAGGFRPPGSSVRSISEKSPPVCAATAFKAITLPRAVSMCPAPGGMMPMPATFPPVQMGPLGRVASIAGTGPTRVAVRRPATAQAVMLK